jgi:hypothetical protein
VVAVAARVLANCIERLFTSPPTGECNEELQKTAINLARMERGTDEELKIIVERCFRPGFTKSDFTQK